MAVVIRFTPSARQSFRLQPTQVEARFAVFEADGKKVLQIDTMGSDHREMPGKQSQKLQICEDQARELWNLLGAEFGFGN